MPTASAPTQALEVTIYFFAALAVVILAGFATALTLSRRHGQWRHRVEQEIPKKGVAGYLTEYPLQLLTMGDLMASPEIRESILANRETLVPKATRSRPGTRPVSASTITPTP